LGNFTNLVVTEAGLIALQFISAYRYLSVNQISIVSGLKQKSASELLLRLERQKLLGSFGNVGIRGYGKTPKVYYLTKAGHNVLSAECEHLGITVEPYRQVSINSRWSPMMYHRLATLDVMMALERDCRHLTRYRLARTMVEYRREKIGRQWQRETTDYVDKPEIPENRIVPDAGFILENIETSKRALFLIEVDCGTEQLTTMNASVVPQTFAHKINQYDRYLASKRASKRYEAWGEFPGFVLLVITDSAARLDNMRTALRSDTEALYRFYRFSTLTEVVDGFFHENWCSRDANDQNAYGLIRGG